MSCFCSLTILLPDYDSLILSEGLEQVKFPYIVEIGKIQIAVSKLRLTN